METRPLKALHVDAELSWRGGQRQATYLYEGILEVGAPAGFVCRPGSSLQRYLDGQGLAYQALAWRGEADLRAGFRLARYARRKGFEALILHSSHALSWGLMARLFCPGLKLIAVRRVDFPIGNNPLSRLKYRLADRIVAISENVRQVLMSDGVPEGKIVLIRSGINLERFAGGTPDPGFRARWQIPPEAILVGTVAAFTGHKDYPTFLRAAALASERDSRLRFLAVGDGVLFVSMREFASQLGLQGKLIFVGRQDDVGPFLRALDIFVLASKKEGLGTSVLDAMALGKAVAATQAGGIPEMVQHGKTGLLVPPRDFAALAEAILKLAQDPALRAVLGEAAKSRAVDFDYHRMVASYLVLLEQL